MENTLLTDSKTVIEYLARGVEFAAALVIGIAAIEATINRWFFSFAATRLPSRRTKYG